MIKIIIKKVFDMDIWDKIGIAYENKYLEIRNIFLKNGYDKKISMSLSDFVMENKIEISEKKIINNKKDIEKLIKLYDGLYNMKYLNRSDFQKLQYCYNNKNIRFLLDVFLGKLENNLTENLDSYYDNYYEKLVLRISK